MKIIGIGLVVFTTLLVGLSVKGCSDSVDSLAAQKRIMSSLTAKQVAYIELNPYAETRSLISSKILIKDTTTISQLIAAYKAMLPQRAGDGRLSGEWQVELTFTLKNTREINSYIHHTEYSDLIYIAHSTDYKNYGLNDCFASHEVSQILSKHLLAGKRR